MKKLSIIILAVLAFGLLACSENSSGSENKEISEIKAVSGITLISKKNDKYNVYCNQDKVSFSIDNETHNYELTEDKSLENYNGGASAIYKNQAVPCNNL